LSHFSFSSSRRRGLSLGVAETFPTCIGGFFSFFFLFGLSFPHRPPHSFFQPSHNAEKVFSLTRAEVSLFPGSLFVMRSGPFLPPLPFLSLRLLDKKSFFLRGITRGALSFTPQSILGFFLDTLSPAPCSRVPSSRGGGAGLSHESQFSLSPGRRFSLFSHFPFVCSGSIPSLMRGGVDDDPRRRPLFPPTPPRPKPLFALTAIPREWDCPSVRPTSATLFLLFFFLSHEASSNSFFSPLFFQIRASPPPNSQG